MGSGHGLYADLGSVVTFKKSVTANVQHQCEVNVQACGSDC